MAERTFWKALGPGLLFTGAAVGVSHLVQSTRAGAVYGLALLGFILLANLFKYAPFRFGPYYTAATGQSLLEGYRRQGRWALVVYGLLTLGTMFTVQAAVTVVTAGLAKVVLGLEASPIAISGVLILICAGLLAIGHYHWLDRIIKGVVVLLTLSTLAATVLVLPRIPWGTLSFWPSSAQLNPKDIFFIAAVVGWMPSAIDVAVWQSLWTQARAQDTGHRPSIRESMLDFNIGYLGTVLLALCFLLLGTGVMHGQGIAPAESAGAFAAQIIGLYTKTLGSWSGPIISVAAFAVMFSTTLTVTDGFPRALSVLLARFRDPEGKISGAPAVEAAQRDVRVTYWISLAVLGGGALLVLHLWLTSLKAMVDLATTLSFVTAPILAWLNHRAVTGPEVPEDKRPSLGMLRLSALSIAVLGAFTLYYLWLRFFPTFSS